MKILNVKSVSFLLVALLATSMVYSQSAPDYKSKIEALNKQIADNMLAGSSEKTLGLYTDDAISLPSYEPIQEGIAAIKESNEKMAKSGWKCLAFELSTLKVIPGGNLVTEIGTYKMSGSMPGMDKPMDDHGKYVTIWEKQNDGSLKIKVETWNSDVDPMSMMKTADQSKSQK
jgi:ketosteroid isomerase-like protein